MLEDVKPRSTIQNSVTEKSLHNHMLEDPLMNHMLEDPLMNKQHVRGSPHEHVRGSFDPPFIKWKIQTLFSSF